MPVTKTLATWLDVMRSSSLLSGRNFGPRVARMLLGTACTGQLALVGCMGGSSVDQFAVGRSSEQAPGGNMGVTDSKGVAGANGMDRPSLAGDAAMLGGDNVAIDGDEHTPGDRDAGSSGGHDAGSSGDGADTADAGDGVGTADAGDGVGTADAGDGVGAVDAGDGVGTADAGDGVGAADAGDGVGAVDAGDGVGAVDAGDGVGAVDAGDGVGAADAGAGHVGPDWQTFQGNPAHNGYVPVTLEPNHFAEAWEWAREPGGVLGFINAVTTEAGKVFVTDDVYHGKAYLYALNEEDGSLAWRWDFGTVPALNPPAAFNGLVYAATTGHEETILRAFRTSDGELAFSSPFDAQWSSLFAPTVSGGRVFTNGGYYGGGVYAYDATSGASLWSRTAGDDDMTTPAVDENYAYYYSGVGLEVYSNDSGNLIASISDPNGARERSYSYHAAPMLGSSDNIIAFSGGAFSGRAAASGEQYESRPLVNFSLQNRATRWLSEAAYLTHPAVAKGVVYAGQNGPVLDALSEATGEVLWSWAATGEDTSFHRNVIVTDNLLFVSTNQAVHAIDLATRRSVWSYPVPGMLAISGRQMLYIAEGARNPTGRLIAIKLN